MGMVTENIVDITCLVYPPTVDESFVKPLTLPYVLEGLKVNEELQSDQSLSVFEKHFIDGEKRLYAVSIESTCDAIFNAAVGFAENQYGILEFNRDRFENIAYDGILIEQSCASVID